MSYHERSVARAVKLVEFLMEGPATAEDIMDGLGVDRATFRNALRLARNEIGTQHGVAIPRPTAVDGYLYRVTGNWIDPDDPAIADGVAAATKDGLTRMGSIIRDYEIAEVNSDGRSREGKQVRQHLAIVRGAMASMEAVNEQLGLVTVTNGSNN